MNSVQMRKSVESTAGGHGNGMCVGHSLLGEQVPVGAAVLHGDAVAFAAHAVPRHGDGAVVVCQGGVLQHRHVPQEGVRALFSLQTNRKLLTRRLLIDSQAVTLSSKRTDQDDFYFQGS